MIHITILVIFLALGCLPDLDGQSSILNTTHSSDIELGGIELEMTLKSPHWWLALIVSESQLC